jgi:3-oxoacyl-[acyl-carrier-protein] synthase III
MRVDGVYISGIGAYLPRAVTSEEAIADGRYDEETYRLTGLQRTHIADDEPALDMAVTAARTALARAGKDITDVETVVHASNENQGADGASRVGYVLRELGGNEIHTMEVRQGCNGMLGAIDVGVGYLTGAAGMSTALLTAAESFSTPLIDRWRGFGPGVIMGDGGASLLLSSEAGFAQILAANSGTISELEQWHRGAESLLPQQDTTYRPIDMTQRTVDFMATGVSLPDVIERLAKFNVALCRRTLVDAGINVADVTRVIANNADERMLEQCYMQPLGLPMSRTSWDIGRGVGHVGACDQTISLDRLLLDGALGPGDHAMLLSSGPGMVNTCVIVKVLSAPAWAG